MEKNILLIIGIIICIVLAGSLVWMAKKARTPTPISLPPEIQAPTPPVPPTPPTPPAPPPTSEIPTIEEVEKDLSGVDAMKIDDETEIQNVLKDTTGL